MASVDAKSHENVSKEMDTLRTLMKKKGLKSTSQRDELARWIFETHNHFTVEDIIADFRNKGQRVSVATAYRVVQMMLDLGLLLEHDFGRGIKHYEHTPGHPHHDHIICNDCGKIVEFAEPELESMKEKVAIKHGYKMDTHTLCIYAECTKCTMEEKEKNKKKFAVL